MDNRQKFIRRAFGTLTLLAALFVSSSSAQVKAGFISRLGVDTVVVERYTRSGNKIEGDLVVSFPRATVTHYVAMLDAQGRVTKFDLATRAATAAADAPPLLERMSTVSDSVVMTEVKRNGKRDTVNSGRTIVRPGAIPSVGNSNVFYEQMILQTMSSKTDSTPVDLFTAGPQGRQPNYVLRTGKNSYTVGWFAGLPLYLKADGSGYIQSVDTKATTVKVIVDRVKDADIEGMAKALAAKEMSAGRPAGQLSPRDTTRATIAGSQLWIDYSKPMKRGRKIFGELVPWYQVWRTGANAATQLSTSKDIKIGATVIPAGKYTLWTLPTPTGTKLIVNKQTGQWGTAYDEKQDFARVDIKTEALAQSVEGFTVTIVAQGNGGEIRMDWDTTRFVVPFAVQ